MTDKPYTHSSKTDVLATFRRFGWTPPSEIKEYQDKWQYYRQLPLKEHTDEKGTESHIYGQVVQGVSIRRRHSQTQ